MGGGGGVGGEIGAKRSCLHRFATSRRATLARGYRLRTRYPSKGKIGGLAFATTIISNVLAKIFSIVILPQSKVRGVAPLDRQRTGYRTFVKILSGF